MATMMVAQVSKARGDFEIVERQMPQPGPRQVRLRVQACGICRSDELTKDGLWPGITFPRVPGHEIAGVIDAVGDGVTGWTRGQRVGVGWHGGHDGTCLSCRRGDFITCVNAKQPGISYDGGYAEYTVVPVEALAAMPDSLDAPIRGAAVVCRHHYLQFLAPQWRGARRSWWQCRASAAWDIWVFNSPAGLATKLQRSVGEPLPRRWR
jgi:D-arabinose 1-dehydrogenase-like Zn-dependent alcohol dehydrogenase